MTYCTLEQAVACLNQNHLVGIPAETVYGLAANAYNICAVKKIFHLKGRPAANPLIVHGYAQSNLQDVATFTPLATQLASAFWPGPLTLVLERSRHCPVAMCVSAGLSTVAVRVPAHPVLRALLQQLSYPLAAPSANPSGRISPTCSMHVRYAFPDLPVLEGGRCEKGLESTVVDARFKVPRILRLGSITQEDIAEISGRCDVHQTDTNVTGTTDSDHLENKTTKILSPGQYFRHYAPLKPLRLHAQHVKADEGLLAFGASMLCGAKKVYNLSVKGCLQEAAHNLFDGLHTLDTMTQVHGIAVMPIPHKGLGCVMNERLMRAAEK